MRHMLYERLGELLATRGEASLLNLQLFGQMRHKLYERLGELLASRGGAALLGLQLLPTSFFCWDYQYS
jgi:hypothetical protein